MTDRDNDEFEHRLARRVERLLERLEALIEIGIIFLKSKLSPPSAPVLAGFIDSSGDSMNAVLVATIPTTRGDGSPLAPTDIASITYQKTSLGADGSPGPQTSLQVNSAVAGAGLALTDLTFTDTNSVAGDSYTCFVTDTVGDAGAVSNAVVNVPVVVKPAAPSAPTLAATFS